MSAVDSTEEDACTRVTKRKDGFEWGRVRSRSIPQSYSTLGSVSTPSGTHILHSFPDALP